MDWGHPENIIWLFAVPVFIGLSIYVYRWRNRARKKFADPDLIQKLFPGHNSGRFWFKTILMAVGLTLGILALMDPLYGEEEVLAKREGTDIIYALDLSNSMYAEDVAPSRLEKSKKIITESLSRLGGDRVGLIVFAQDAYMISPLTTDYNSIASFVENASPDMISNQGTNFLSVIETADEMFKKVPVASKLLIVISDGEDNEQSLSKAITLAKSNKIKIVSVGVGTASGGPIPMDYNGFEEYKMDRYGDIVITKFDERTLKSLAQSSSGIYIRAEQTNSAVDKTHSFINQMQKQEHDSSASMDKKHVFHWFLGLAFIFIFIDTLTSETKLFNNKK